MQDHYITAQRAHVAALARKGRGSTHGADVVRALAQVCDDAAAYALGLTSGDVGEPCERVIVADARNAWRVTIGGAFGDLVAAALGARAGRGAGGFDRRLAALTTTQVLGSLLRVTIAGRLMRGAA